MGRWRWLASWSALVALITAADPVVATSADEARDAMVQIVELQIQAVGEQIDIGEIDPRVLDAMRRVPRHVFVPEELRPYAYGDHPLPVGHEQNIAAPLLVALMTQLVAPRQDDVVYETGTGAGYHAAVLSLLVDEVYSVEVVEPLAARAAELLKTEGYDNVHVQASDGYYGWPAHAPFDAIIVKEAIDHVPPPLLAQLQRGGRLVMPLGPANGPQYLTLVTKNADGRTSERRIMPVRFSPLQGGERL